MGGGRVGGGDKAPRVILSGEVGYFRLPEVMHMVSLGSLTGRLGVRHEDKEVSVYFRDGMVVFAADEARGTKEMLGSLLVGMGRLTQDALASALSRSASGGARLGDLLVEEGLVTMRDISSAVMKQTERSVYRAMAWTGGAFEFTLGEPPEFVEALPLELDVDTLIIRGVRKVALMRAIAELVPSLDVVFVKTPFAPVEPERAGLGAVERQVLSLVDGTRTAGGIITVSGLSEYDALEAVHTLYSAGMIRKLEQKKRAERTQYL